MSNGQRVKSLLKSTINVNDSKINPFGCKKLSEFIIICIKIAGKIPAIFYANYHVI